MEVDPPTAEASSPHSTRPPDNNTSGSSNASSSSKFSCIVCHNRKVKCDRGRPCSNCVKYNVHCEYRTPPRPRRKGKTTERTLVEKLLRYEEYLRKIGAPLDALGEPVEAARNGLSEPGETARHATATTAASAPTSAPAAAAADATETPNASHQAAAASFHSHTCAETKPDQGTLIADQNRTRYLENSLWVTLNHELNHTGSFAPMKNDIRLGHDCPDGLDDESSGEEADFSLSTLLLSPDPRNPVELYPTPPHVTILWRTFLDNVHPLTKMVHAPSVQKLMDQSCRDVRAISRANMALLFSIHHFAVQTMTEIECQTQLGQTQAQLTKKYQAALQRALIRCKFLNTSELTVLVAFMNLLLSIRICCDAQTIWTLTGVAYKIGQRIGLHRDPSKLPGLSPFEMEMRKRVWHQVMILDFASSELAGATASGFMLAHTINLFLPSNLNDSDLDPNMKESPKERVGPTEMIFCRLRCEFASFIRDVQQPFISRPQGAVFDGPFSLISGPGATLEEKDKRLDDLQQKIEHRILRYCDPIDSLHYLTATVARTAITGMRLRAHHPRQYRDGGASLPTEEKERIFNWSIKILQYDTLLVSAPQIRKFMWHIRSYFQFNALIYLLVEARFRCTGDAAEAMWREFEAVYANHHELLDTKQTLHTAIAILVLRAWEAREGALGKDGRNATPPGFVQILRNRARAKGEARRGLAAGSNGGMGRLGSVPVTGGDGSSAAGTGGLGDVFGHSTRSAMTSPPGADNLAMGGAGGGDGTAMAHWFTHRPLGLGSQLGNVGNVGLGFGDSAGDWAHWDNLVMSTFPRVDELDGLMMNF